MIDRRKRRGSIRGDGNILKLTVTTLKNPGFCTYEIGEFYDV